MCFSQTNNTTGDSIEVDQMDLTEKMRFIQIASQYVMPRLKQVDEIPKRDSVFQKEYSVMIYTHRDLETGE